MNTKSFALILNPITLVRHRTRWAKLCALLDDAGLAYTIFECRSAASITAQTRSALEQGFTHILPIGGDGTLSLAAHAFMEGDRNLFPEALLVPMDFGTGHDFYSGVIPKSFHGEFRWILNQSKSERISLGTYNTNSVQKYFINSLSLGISSQVIEKRERSGMRQGKSSYLLATLQAIAGYKPSSVAIEVNGESFGGSTLLLMLSKGPLVGGGMRLVSAADPKADTCAALWIPALPLVSIIRNFSKIYKGQVDRVAGVKSFQFNSLSCRFSGAKNFIEADGELCPVDTHLHVRILPQCLSLLLPSDAPHAS